MSEAAPQIAAPTRLQTTSWILYDLANTIYSATVTYLLGRYIQSATWLGATTTLSMLTAALGTPLFASIADRTGRAGRYCTVTTLVCIAGMAYFGIGDAVFGLLLAYFIANVCYQAALVFYNSLLPSVATAEHMGVVSGLGVGLGYLGSAFTLAILLPVKAAWGWKPAFLTGAAVFLAVALPCMLFVRDRRHITPEKISRGLVRRQWRELMNTVLSLPRYPRLMWFLAANFFAVDVLNTAILFYGRLVEKSFEGLLLTGPVPVFGMQITKMDHLVIVAGIAVTVPALGFGLLLGYLADRLGSARAFVVSVASLTVGLLAAALFSGWAPSLFLVAMCGFGGLGLAGIWTAGRKMLVELVPQELVARYFGLYGITTKISIIGSFVCGVFMDKWGPRAGILS